MLFDTPDIMETEEERLRRQLIEGGVNSLAADAFMGSPAAKEHLASGGPVYGNINPMAVDLYQKANNPSPGLEAPGVMPMALDIYNKAQSKDYTPLMAGINLNAAPITPSAAPVMGPPNPYSGIMGPEQPTTDDYRHLPIGTMIGNSRVSGGGAIVNDGFNAAGNLIGTNSPNPTEYTGPGAGYGLPSAGDARYGNQLNVMRSVDDANYAKQFDPMLLAHKFSMEKQAALLANQLEQTRIASGHKSENENEKRFNEGLKLSGDPRVPANVATAKIKALRDDGAMDRESADFAILDRLLSVSQDGKTFQPIQVKNSKTGEFNLKEVVSRIPDDIPVDTVQQYLAQSRGIDINKVKERYMELLNRGSNRQWDPVNNPTDWLRKDPSTFDIKNLTSDDRTEYEGILRLFGKRK